MIFACIFCCFDHFFADWNPREYRVSSWVWCRLWIHFEFLNFSWSFAGGWSVTVAGTYKDDMAPDVQMHLSFPKRTASTGDAKLQTIEKSKSAIYCDNGNYGGGRDENENFDEDESPQAILPPPQSKIQSNWTMNPKRNLSRNRCCTGDQNWTWIRRK